nr:syntaxin-51 [Quercus suber]
MSANLNMSSFNNRDSLLGPNIKQGDIMNRTNGLNNHGLVGYQWQIMNEQDEDLEKLEETVTSTKHISLAVNEKLSLHTRLLVWSFTDVIPFLICFSNSFGENSVFEVDYCHQRNPAKKLSAQNAPMKSGKVELNRKGMSQCPDRLKNFRSKVNQMAATPNLSSFNNRDSLVGPNIKQGDIISGTNGLNNHGLVGF